jgi:hypothetical protein
MFLSQLPLSSLTLVVPFDFVELVLVNTNYQGPIKNISSDLPRVVDLVSNSTIVFLPTHSPISTCINFAPLPL